MDSDKGGQKNYSRNQGRETEKTLKNCTSIILTTYRLKEQIRFSSQAERAKKVS